ncbi:MAG: oxygen-dependent coproporphyrinogen oxidase [Alphaproteobacteria bacterium]|nr:oxygen-dependent coproporphyrinogen oxidase [Alphaproteobacteria bacterium]
METSRIQPITAAVHTFPTQEQKERAAAWFKELRDRICAELEKIEAEYASSARAVVPSPDGTERMANEPARFIKKSWERETPDNLPGGGGVMGQLRGRVFEKGGVNISTTYGHFSPEFRKQIPGAAETGAFWASGISLVLHPTNPHVPPVHMNTRHIVTTRGWFGGGSDLNPNIPNDADTTAFHARLKHACDAHSPDYYEKYKAWADEYFFNKHRNEPRGVGGIFYDYHDSGNWDADFKFTQDVGLAFLDIYPKLVRRHMYDAFTPEDKQQQSIRRGRYVEFNLVYDRGTKFGLMTGGNTEAILMSLPPDAKWI